MTPIYIFLLPEYQPRPNISCFTKLRSLDWLGAVLSSAMYVTFAMIFTFGGSIWPWSDGRMIALYVVCGATTVGFGVTQYWAVFTTKSNRLFPCEFLRTRTLVLLFICSACLGGSLFVIIYYIPLYFQFVRADNGIRSAVRLLPFICFYVLGVILNGFLMLRWGYYMPWFFVAGVLTTIGGALMFSTNSYTSPSSIYGYSVILSLGMTAYQAAYSVIPAKVSPIQFINVAQQGSILIALSICSTVFQNTVFFPITPNTKPGGL